MCEAHYLARRRAAAVRLAAKLAVDEGDLDLATALLGVLRGAVATEGKTTGPAAPAATVTELPTWRRK